MSHTTQTTGRYLNDLCLGVLISTPRHYVNIDAARLHLNFILKEYIDEPVTFFYEKKDANALSILKGTNNYRFYCVSEEQIAQLNSFNTLVIFYHHGVSYKDRTFNEILCKRFRSLYTFDTNLRVNYE